MQRDLVYLEDVILAANAIIEFIQEFIQHRDLEFAEFPDAALES